MSYYNRYDRYGYGYNSSANEKDIKRDFLNYAEKDKLIKTEGMEKMGRDLGIDIYKDIIIVFILFKCGCDNMDSINEEQFTKGLKALNVSSIKNLKSKLTSLREELLDFSPDSFRKFYNYLFDLNVPGTPMERKKKTLEFEIVKEYFNSLFAPQFPELIKEFLTFLEELKVGLKWDEWCTFLDFIQSEGTRFPKDYNCADRFPVIVDRFYKWYCTKKGIKIKDPEEDED